MDAALAVFFISSMPHPHLCLFFFFIPHAAGGGMLRRHFGNVGRGGGVQQEPDQMDGGEWERVT